MVEKEKGNAALMSGVGGGVCSAVVTRDREVS